ncbi:MAG: response regulator [Lachnospiraceae bacterium]|nr:response regulator [Lachnospiraceae bacterium]
MRIGETIKVRRRAVKLTQEELAEKLNVTPQAVSRWENEVSLPDITLVPRICDELNISIDQLMKDFESRQADYLETKPVAEPLTQKEIDAIFGFVRGQEKEDHRTVLHADDAEFLRMLTKDALKSQGYKVLQAKNGKECMKMLYAKEVDILLLDINMPGYNGLDILGAVSEQFPKVKVLMLSALTDEATVREALKRGAKGFVAKPYNNQDLFEHMWGV